MQQVAQIGALGLIGLAVTHNIKNIKEAFESPTERQFVDRNCQSCIGNPEVFHKTGIISGCPKRVQACATIVNNATNCNEQVWLCSDHCFELRTLDVSMIPNTRWQDLPLPRSKRNEFLYGIHTL